MWRILGLIVLVGCSTPNPGISRERAEAILRGTNLTENINIGPDPRGWAGTARFAGGGYTMRVVVNNNGTLDQSPDPCHC
jgi:hypothetical protein